MANPELCAAHVTSCTALERVSSRWPLHPLLDAPAPQPPSEIITRSLCGTQDQRCGVRAAGRELEGAACERARGVYVEAAKKIKENFKAEHPECVLR